MGAIEAVTPQRLPPVGEPVRLAGREPDVDFARRCFAPYAPRFFASGTAALAAAVRAAVVRAERDRPEVLLPAYACPNVVSAVLHAGAKPRLVDLEPERPWMQAKALERGIGPSSVAIIAVDLLGLPERYDMLVPLAREHGLILIQDGAQAFPRRHERLWRADVAVVSFGRGKPVSLLGGGAVLFRDVAFGALLPGGTTGSGADGAGLGFGLKARLYNALRRPSLYWLPAALPALHLGETRFVPLLSVVGAQPGRLRHLQANVENYWQRDEAPERAIAALVASLDPDAVVDLPRACAGDAGPRLLRYPLLVKGRMLRDRLYRALHAAGLGVSTLYGSPLPGIRGLGVLGEGTYSRAQAFARQLLTLPVHSGVTPVHIERMRACFGRFGLTR